MKFASLPDWLFKKRTRGPVRFVSHKSKSPSWSQSTTALALASAVPAVVAYNYFQRRLKVLGSEMSNFGADFMNIVKRHFF